MADASLSETARKNDANSGRPFCSWMLRIFMEKAQDKGNPGWSVDVQGGSESAPHNERQVAV